MAQTSIQFRPRGTGGAPGSVTGARTEVVIEGMTCGNCARHATEALQGVPGVAFAVVDLAQGRATVRWHPNVNLAPQKLVEAVTGAGFVGRLVSAAAMGVTVAPSTASTTSTNPWKRSLQLGIPATALLLGGDWLMGWGMHRWFHWVGFWVALPVQILAGAGFYQGAWRQLKAQSANMDTLVSLGSTAAFGFSVWALLTRAVPHLFFAESVTILTLISLGHRLESGMSTKAGEALRVLLELSPPKARKLSPKPGSQASVDSVDLWTESEVPVATLVVGDRIVIKPGDRVPVDAEVVEGRSSLDESMLTGESMPVEKALGSSVLAGTSNQSGRLVARVMATGEATALAGIVAAVQRAQSSRAHIQRLADQVSSVFVPVVIAIAVLAGSLWLFIPESTRAWHQTWSGWFWHTQIPESNVAAAFYVVCSVLIVACPCAMGIATPVALMAGVNAAARRGILIRDAQALEKSGTVTAIVFDKTGTLTEGAPKVTQVHLFGGSIERADALRLAASMARSSQHPLSQAIAKLDPSTLPLADVEEVRGSGIQARHSVSGPNGTPVRVRLGSLAWLAGDGVDLTPGSAAAEMEFQSGGSVIGLSVGHQLIALLTVRDTLKPQAVALIAELRARPFEHRAYLLSGDHPRAVEFVARELGVDGSFAEVRPEEKAAKIRELQSRGLKVAFVGDGINDAPALAQADLGIAVARASDAAREAADIVLLRSDLTGVRDALMLSRATLRTIRQNLFWAFFYNAAAVPLAALGLLSPVVCALSMGLSDVIVIGNALRLSRKKV